MSLLTAAGVVVPEQAGVGNAQLVTDRQLSLYTATRAGRAFHGAMAAAGAVIPIFSNTAQVVGLWNQAGGTIYGVLTAIELTYVSTTGAAGGFVLGVTREILPGTSVSAFTDGTINATIWNGLMGSTVGPTIRFTPSAATVVAPVIAKRLGINQLVITAADATNSQWGAIREFRGDVILPPGNFMCVAGNIATLITESVGISWVEEAT